MLKHAAKFGLFVWIFIVVMSLANGAVEDDHYLLVNLTFEDPSLPTFINSSNNWHVSATGKYKGTYGLFVSNSNADTYAYISNTTFHVNSSDFPLVIRGWFKDNSGTVDKPLAMFPFVASNSYEATGVMHSTVAYTINYYWDGGANYDQTEKTDAFTDDWFFLELNITNSTITNYAYQSDAMDIYSDAYDSHTLFASTGYFGFYCYNECYYDDIEIWVGGSIGAPAPPSASVTFTTPTLSNGNYTDILFQHNITGTPVNTGDSFNCSLYINDTLNLTLQDVDVTAIPKWNLSIGNEEQYWDFDVTCSNNNATGSINVTNVLLDSVTPDITQNLENNTFFYHNVDTLLNLSATCSDPNLYSCNLTIWQLNGSGARTYQWNNTFVENINESSYTLNITLIIDAALNNTRYEIYKESADSHTDSVVRNLTWLAEDNLVQAGDIYFEGDLKAFPLTYFYLSESGDRYKFKVTFKEDKLTHVLIITADGALTYRPPEQDGYLGHFVHYSSKRWVDMQGDNVKNVIVTHLGNNKYQLEIELYTASDELEFESIGDLNFATASSYFNITEGFTFYARDGIANTSIANFTITIWNGTTTLQTKNTGTGNITFNLTALDYQVNITSGDYIDNTTYNLTFSSNSFYTFNLTAGNSLYLFIYDEQTNELINDRNVTVDIINYDNVSTTETSSTGSTFVSGFSIGNYEINYVADGYILRSYYTQITGGDTQLIDLYLLNDTEGSYKNFEVVDESASPVTNATVKMQRYYVSENAWKIVEMAKTNDAGEGVLYAELYDVNYRFVIDYLGNTEKITAQTKLDTRDLYFKITLLDSGLQSYFDAGGVTVALSYDNATDLWTFDYNTPSTTTVSAANLVVEVENVYDTIRVCNNTLAAGSGSITCNQSAYNGDNGQFFAHGYVTTGGASYPVASDSMSYSTKYETFGMTGLFLGFIIVATMAMVGLWSPVAAIVMSLFGLVIVVQLGLLYLTTTWLIGMVIVGIIFIAHIRT